MAGGSTKKSSESGQPVENQGQENRYLPRWDVANRVVYKFDTDMSAHECRSKDLSCAGACLVLKEQSFPEQKVRLTIFLDENVSVEVEGHVRWNKPSEDGHLVGIDFEKDTPTEVKDVLLNYAFEIKREDLVKHWFGGWSDSK